MKTRQRIRKLLLLFSLVLYPVTFFIMSPDLLFFGASQRIVAGDILFFFLLLVLSIFIGRLFCGWICPAGSLQEAAFSVNDRPANNRFNWIKMAFFFPWLAFFVFLVVMAGGFTGADIFYEKAFGIPIAGAIEMTMYFGTVAIVLALALFGGKRGLCHYLCWVSPFMIIGMKIREFIKIPALHLKTAPDSCKSCGICTKNCPMSLPVESLVKNGEIRDTECILCASCVDSCPRGVIHFTFGK